MPVNDRFPLPEVLAECHRYFALRRRKVFVEYVMLAGVNDSPERAKELAALLDPKVFKVNLIPYNPTGILRRLLARGDRRVQERARPRAHPVDGAAHPRPRHRGRLRPARGDALAGRPVGRLRVQVVGAAGTALGRVVLAGRHRGVVGGDAERDQMRVLGRDAEPERDALGRLDGVALRLASLTIPRRCHDSCASVTMPKTARSVSSSQPPPIRHANDVWSRRQTRSRPRQVVAERLVLSLGPAVLVEVDPAGVRRDLDEPRPEARDS